ncbi:MAG: hypothetical protein AB7F32_06980 [Victivallaceae bacterium]
MMKKTILTAAVCAIAIFAAATEPETSGVAAARTAAIQKDLAENQQFLDQYGSFAAMAAALKPAMEANNAAATVKNAGKWVNGTFVAPGPVQMEPGDYTEFKKGIIRLNQFLKRRNIDLIVVRFPSRHEAAFPFFAGQPVGIGVSNPYYRQLERELLEADVEYIDGLKAVHSDPTSWPLYYWYNIPGEGHPAEGALQAVANVVAERLQRYALPRTGNYRLADDVDQYNQNGRTHRYPAGNPGFAADAPVVLKVLRDAEGKAPEIIERNQSPLLYISDSYGGYVGKSNQGASLPHYVMAKNQHLADWMYRSGSSEGAATFLARKGEDFLRGRRVIVLNAHPGNLRGVSILYDDDLLYVKPERLHPLLTFQGDTLAKIPHTAAENTLKVLPNGSLRLSSTPTMVNPPRFELKLPAAAQAYRAVAIQLTLSKHSYLSVIAKSGKYMQRELLSTSEKVPVLSIYLRLDGDTVTLDFPYAQNE